MRLESNKTKTVNAVSCV